MSDATRAQLIRNRSSKFVPRDIASVRGDDDEVPVLENDA